MRKYSILDNLKQLMIDKAGSTKLVRPIDNAGTTTSFSSDEAFHGVTLSVKKLKLFVSESDSKENENEVDVTG